MFRDGRTIEPFHFLSEKKHKENNCCQKFIKNRLKEIVELISSDPKFIEWVSYTHNGSVYNVLCTL